MNKITTSLVVCLLLLCVCGCKQQNKDIAMIQEVVQQVNAKAGVALANGTTLSKCEYMDSDSLFTYYIKVNDKRYDKAEVEDIKSSIRKEFSSPAMGKIIKLLNRNHIGLRYVYDTPTKKIEIIFPSNELSL